MMNIQTGFKQGHFSLQCKSKLFYLHFLLFHLENLHSANTNMINDYDVCHINVWFKNAFEYVSSARQCKYMQIIKSLTLSVLSLSLNPSALSNNKCSYLIYAQIKVKHQVQVHAFEQNFKIFVLKQQSQSYLIFVNLTNKDFLESKNS